MKRYLSALWHNRATLLLVAIFVLVAGALAFRQLPRSVFPDVTFPRVNVMATWGYAPPKLVLLQLTFRPFGTTLPMLSRGVTPAFESAFIRITPIPLKEHF